MASTTPRVQLIKPATSDSMVDADAQIGQSWELVDLYAGAREVAALPGSSFVGDLVRLTTGASYFRWSGTKWQFCGTSIFQANSFESNNSQDSRFDGFAGAEILANPANSFSVTNNRTYYIGLTVMLEYEADTSGFFRVRVRRSAINGAVSTSSQIVREFRVFVDSNGTPTKGFEGFDFYAHTDPTGVYQFGVFAQPETAVDFHVGGGAGSGGSNKSSSQLVIFEVGF